MFWDPFTRLGLSWPGRDGSRFADELEHFFRQPGRLAARPGPAWNVSIEDGQRVLVSVPLPGLGRDDFELSLEDGRLSLSGAYPTEESLGETGRALVRERPHGRFTRSLRLPFRVETADVAARFSRGVLTIELPRAKADLPVRIEVSSN